MRQSTADGIVLLKNDGNLPLTLRKGSRVAMIGMWANAERQMQGGYSGVPPYLHSPVLFPSRLRNGPINDSTETTNMTQDALAAANASEIVLYFGRIDSIIEEKAMDCYSIAWSAAQLD